MTNRRFLAQFGIVALAALLPASEQALAQESVTATADLGARIVLRNGVRQYIIGDGVLYSYTADSLKTPAAAVDRTAAAVKVTSRSEAYSLRLDVSALFGTVVTDSMPDWANDFAEQTGPSYSLRDGDTIALTELLPYGV